MNRPSIDRRIFIVGVPRSGTTLLQSLLATHGEVASFTESHFFARHFSFLPGFTEPVLTRNPAPRVSEFLAENGAAPGDAAQWFSHEGRWRLLVKPLLPFQTRSVARRLLRVLDELALRRDLTTWVEKTPRHLRYVPFLERLAGSGPAPQFVHLVRKGMQVVASLHEASQSWQRPYGVDTCVARWNRDVAFSLSRLAAPHDHFVLYEELTTRPEPTLRRLLAQLDLPWQATMLEQYGQAAAALTTNDETWKAGIGRRIRPAATADQALTHDQQERVRESLRADLYRQIADAVARRSDTLDSSS
jgi:hypothetical protein